MQFSLKKASLALALALPAGLAQAEQPPYKVGLMLPATGTFADVGTAITNGFKLYVDQQGGQLGGRKVEYVTLDDESNPAKAVENTNKLVKRDKVDVLVGTAHSGVALAMAKVAKESNTLLVIPNAGADEITGPLCAPNIFRTSFSNWQPAYAMGQVAAARGAKKVVTLTWNYTAGQQYVEGFKEAFEKAGGKVVKEMTLGFPDVEFQAYLAEIAAIKPDAVYVFFAGSGAAKFAKDYAAAGLKGSIPLYATGFLTEGTLQSMGEAGNELLTTLHYADDLDNPTDKAFRQAYVKAYQRQPDVYAVHGYDSAQLLAKGLAAVGGDTGRREEMIKAMETAEINSPRGPFTLSKAHNPVQNFYLRRSSNGENKYVDTVIKGLADPARGCKM